MGNWQQVWNILRKYKGAEVFYGPVIGGFVILALYVLLKDKMTGFETYMRHALGMPEVQYPTTAYDGTYVLLAMIIGVAVACWVPLRRQNSAGKSFRCNSVVFASLQQMEARLREAFAKADGPQASAADKEAFMAMAQETGQDLAVLAPHIRAEGGFAHIITVSYYDRSSAGGYLSPDEAVARIKAKG